MMTVLAVDSIAVGLSPPSELGWQSWRCLFSGLASGGREQVAKDATKGIANVCKGVDRLLLARLQYGPHHCLRCSAGLRPVAAPDLSVDDRRLQRLFTAVIRRWDARVFQELQPLLAMVV